MFKHILITGASSGIGEALALLYAAPGVTLSLTGRDPQRVADIAKACEQRGATVSAIVIDAADRAAMANFIAARDAAAPLDLIVANAGISGGTGGLGESVEQARRIFAVNVDGVFNTVQPAMELMKPRRRGHIAIMASLAGYRGMAGAPAYCASKAAVKVWGEGLRGELARHDIGVSVICPGFVVSRMTAVNRFPMPFLMDTDRAARIIARGLASNRGRIAFPWPMAFAVWLMAALPDGVSSTIGRMLPAKG